MREMREMREEGPRKQELKSELGRHHATLFVEVMDIIIRRCRVDIALLTDVGNQPYAKLQP